MSIVVHDIDRPDVNGVPPKMQAICEKLREELSAPWLSITTDDNLMSSVTIKGSLDPREEWSGKIWQNSRYFYFHVCPMGGKRYYSPDDAKVTVEMPNASYKLGKFRKYTGPVDKVITKIAEWIKSH